MIRMWIDACRPKTLVAALVPVVMGGLVFWIYGDPLHLGAQRDYLFTFFSCLGFALSAQILSNFSNDLGDSLRGADNQNRVGPKRAVANGLISARAMKIAMVLVITLACLSGWSLGMHHPILFIPGILALILAMGYTLGPLPLAYHGLGDVFVVACFGLQATALTVYALYLEVGKTVVCEMPPKAPAICDALNNCPCRCAVMRQKRCRVWAGTFRPNSRKSRLRKVAMKSCRQAKDCASYHRLPIERKAEA